MGDSALHRQEASITQTAAEGGGKLRGGETYRKFGEKPQQLKKGVFGTGSFRNLCAELCFVFFCVLR